MKWEAKIINHRNESRIAIAFERNPVLIERLKKLEDARWSRQRGVWHLPAEHHTIRKYTSYSGRFILFELDNMKNRPLK